jgi:hypothetical protein
MCFKKKIKPPEYTLLHPEEKPDYSITMDNYNLDKVIDKWLNDWHVPMDYWNFWSLSGVEIIVTLDTVIYFDGKEYKHAPAQSETSNDERVLKVRPEYLNAGVIAHEQAHNSYSLLNVTDQANFNIDLQPFLKTGIVQYLFTQNAYGLTSPVESHAEIYRYIDVPQSLRKYYPKLYT